MKAVNGNLGSDEQAWNPTNVPPPPAFKGSDAPEVDDDISPEAAERFAREEELAAVFQEQQPWAILNVRPHEYRVKWDSRAYPFPAGKIVRLNPRLAFGILSLHSARGLVRVHPDTRGMITPHQIELARNTGLRQMLVHYEGAYELACSVVNEHAERKKPLSRADDHRERFIQRIQWCKKELGEADETVPEPITAAQADERKKNDEKLAALEASNAELRGMVEQLLKEKGGGGRK